MAKRKKNPMTRPTLDPDPPPLLPGQRLARGVARGLGLEGFAPLTEFVLKSGLRADVLAIGPGGEIWIVECKSSRADFASDRKWPGYIPWCDAFFWAVDPDFPSEILPADAGLIVGDEYDAEILRRPEPRSLAPARRKALTLRFAHVAAARLEARAEPPWAAPGA